MQLKLQISREAWVVITITLVGLAIVALLAFGVWEQVERLRAIEAAEAELLPLVAREKERNERLVQELKHVSSPSYPEEWARVYAGMARDGEVVLEVPPVDAPDPSPTPAAPVVQEDAPTSFWTRLRRWVTGDTD